VRYKIIFQYIYTININITENSIVLFFKEKDKSCCNFCINSFTWNKKL